MDPLAEDVSTTSTASAAAWPRARRLEGVLGGAERVRSALGLHASRERPEGTVSLRTDCSSSRSSSSPSTLSPLVSRPGRTARRRDLHRTSRPRARAAENARTAPESTTHAPLFRTPVHSTDRGMGRQAAKRHALAKHIMLSSARTARTSRTEQYIGFW